LPRARRTLWAQKAAATTGSATEAGPPPSWPGLGARSHPAKARHLRRPPHPATRGSPVPRAGLGPRRSGVLTPSHSRLPARDCGASGVWGQSPHDPQQSPGSPAEPEWQPSATVYQRCVAMQAIAALTASWGERVFELAPHLDTPLGETAAKLRAARLSRP